MSARPGIQELPTKELEDGEVALVTTGRRETDPILLRLDKIVYLLQLMVEREADVSDL